MYYRLPNKEILRGFQMNNINFIQNAIMQLEGGAFQKLFDAYMYKKYKFNNIRKRTISSTLTNICRSHG